jgi:AraC-like DNA-binding protein
VRSERISRATAMLSDQRYDHLRIIDIAFENGFSDLSTFNRAFRHETGETPTAVREYRLSRRPAGDTNSV